MEKRTVCYVIDSDEATDCENFPILKDDGSTYKFNLCQKVFDKKETLKEKGTTIFEPTLDVQDFNENENNLPTRIEEKVRQETDFEFDFQSIDEAEQTEHILRVRVHANFCMRCGSGFVHHKRLNVHLEKNKCSPNNFCSGMPFTCSICGRGFFASICLRQHFMLHAQTRPFKCKRCCRCLITQRDLYSHYRTHKNYKPFICNICPKAFFSARNLSAHKQNHSGKNPYLCPICPKKFNCSKNLKTHKRKHASKKPFKCKFCQRRYAQNSIRNLHMRTHTRNKSADLSFLCEICGCIHIRSRSTWVQFHRTPERKNSINSVISIEEEESDKIPDFKTRPKKSSQSSDSVQIVEDPLQFTINLIDE